MLTISRLLAVYYSGKQDIEYKGILNIVTEDDHKYSCPTSGTLSQVLVSTVQVKAHHYGDDGSVEERHLKSFTPTPLEGSVKKSGRSENRILSDDDDTTEQVEEGQPQGNTGDDEEERGYYVDNDGNTAYGADEVSGEERDSAVYKENNDIEPEYQMNCEDDENESADYDERIGEEPVETNYEEPNYDRENQEDEFIESSNINNDQEEEDQHDEEINTESAETELESAHRDDDRNEYEEETWKQMDGENPQRSYREDAEVPNASEEDEYRQLQSYNDIYEGQEDELNGRDTYDQYETSEAGE
jgi:hypothetical protein